MFWLRALLAAALLVRLGGVAVGWLPSASTLLAGLVVAHGLALLVSDPSVSLSRRLRSGWAVVSTHTFGVSLAVLAVAGVLYRVFDIGVDLGQSPLGIDERRLAQSVLSFLRTGEINHETVEHYPGVHFWLLTAVYLLTYLWALMSGIADTFAAVPLDVFVGAGRLTSAVLAAGTIALTGLLGRFLCDARTGLLAAAVVTLSPLAERVSSQLRNDETMVLLILASVSASMWYYRSGQLRWSLVAGGLAGAATAVKYSGVFSLVPAVVAIGFRPAGGSRLHGLALAVVSFGTTLAITNHYVWADVPNFVRQLSDQIAHLGPGHWAATTNPAWVYTSTIAGTGTGWPLLVLALIGGTSALAGGRSARWVVLAFPLTYWWFMSRSPAQLGRWIYPLVPFVAVVGSMTMWSLCDWLTRRWPTGSSNRVRLRLVPSIVILAVTLLPIVQPATIAFSRRLMPSTAEQAVQWIEQRTSPADVVLVENGWLDLGSIAAKVRRVPRLREVLAGGRYQLFANDWIVIPEPYFNTVDVSRLALAREILADFGFKGHQGFDLRIYASPRAATVRVPMDIRLGTEAARPFLGLNWSRDIHDDGLEVPENGASLFVPPATRHPLRILVEVSAPDALVPDTPAVPIVMTVDGVPTPMIHTDDAQPGVWLMSPPIPATVARSGITELRFRGASRGTQPRLRTVALR